MDATHTHLCLSRYNQPCLPYPATQLSEQLNDGRYFLQTWPQLCYLSFDGAKCFGTIVCKLDQHGEFLRGYIAMLVVEQPYRKLGIGEGSTFSVLAGDGLQHAMKVSLRYGMTMSMGEP